MLTQNKRLLGIMAAAGALLLLPLIAMQFTSEVDWNSFDFLIMGVLLFGTGMLIEFALRRVKTVQQRILVVGVILFALFLVWAELAVGVFGTPWAGN